MVTWEEQKMVKTSLSTNDKAGMGAVQRIKRVGSRLEVAELD